MVVREATPHRKKPDRREVLLNEITIPDNAESWLEDALAAGRTIAGFGQPFDATEDPRVPLMRARLSMIAALRRGESLVAVYDALVTAMYDARRRRPSLDLPAGPAPWPAEPGSTVSARRPVDADPPRRSGRGEAASPAGADPAISV